MATWLEDKKSLAIKHYSELKDDASLLSINVINEEDGENIKKIIAFFAYNNSCYTLTAPRIIYYMTILHLKSLGININNNDRIFELVIEEFDKGNKEGTLVSFFDNLDNIIDSKIVNLDEYTKMLLMVNDFYYINKKREDNTCKER